jgi:hypothetical protein
MLWQQISRFPEVYFVQGTPLEQRDLVRAGVLGVDKAIILAGATTDTETGGSSHKGVSNGKKHARMTQAADVC